MTEVDTPHTADSNPSQSSTSSDNDSDGLNRRDFLRASGAAGVPGSLAGCSGQASTGNNSTDRDTGCSGHETVTVSSTGIWRPFPNRGRHTLRFQSYKGLSACFRDHGYTFPCGKKRGRYVPPPRARRGLRARHSVGHVRP
jgi:hypothetical protein